MSGSSGADDTSGGAPVVTSTEHSSSGASPMVTETTATGTGSAMTEPNDASTGSTTDAADTSETGTSAGVEPCVDTVGQPGFDLDGPPGTIANCVDPQVEWDGPHDDCFVACSTATMIVGDGPAADIPAIDRAAFGVTYGECGEGLVLKWFLFGPLGAPTAMIYNNAECALDPWLGVYEVTGRLSDETPISAIMTIEGYAGDWVSAAPVDPPRLFGSLSGDLVGPFEALHCGGLDTYYDHCG